jgi:hypothetical protein
MASSGPPRAAFLVPPRVGQSGTRQVPDRPAYPGGDLPGGRPGGRSLGDAGGKDTRISRPVAADPAREHRAAHLPRAAAQSGRPVPGTHAEDAPPLQFLPLELPGGPQPGHQARHLQAGRRVPRLQLLPPPGGRTDLSGTAGVGDDLLHLLQHALRVLPERGHQHRQGQRPGGLPARWPPWPGSCARRAATTSTGSAGR